MKENNAGDLGNYCNSNKTLGVGDGKDKTHSEDLIDRERPLPTDK